MLARQGAGWRSGRERDERREALSDCTLARVDVEVSRPGDWVVSGASPVLDRSGRDTGRSLACGEAVGCTVPTGLHTRIAYQPADRYWAFQWSETAICLALAGLTGGFCAWWLRRRRS
ncbi:hypothetical protein [Streptomyces chrestomyceticus]|uniref:Uncharacterized protein n=1 Tax=Streptomyces chrestomyceticus TaxID=68185 RepID=A0ABU7X426_9ACTN